MKTGDLIIGLGLAGAAYWAYTRFGGAAIAQNLPAMGPAVGQTTTPVSTSAPPAGGAGANGAQPVNGAGAGSGANNTPPPAEPAKPAGYATLDPAGKPNFSGYIANVLGAGRHQLSADTWNWHFSNFSGVPQTADLFDPGNRGGEMSLTEYINRRVNAGLSGLTGLSGVVPHQFRSAGAYRVRGLA